MYRSARYLKNAQTPLWNQYLLLYAKKPSPPVERIESASKHAFLHKSVKGLFSLRSSTGRQCHSQLSAWAGERYQSLWHIYR